MNDAEALAGLELRVPVERLAPLPAGTFYRTTWSAVGSRRRPARRSAWSTDVEGTSAGSRLVVDGGDAAKC